MDDFVDYEAYARSVPYNKNLVSIPKGETYNNSNSQTPSALTSAIPESIYVSKPRHKKKIEANRLQIKQVAAQANPPAAINPHHDQKS